MARFHERPDPLFCDRVEFDFTYPITVTMEVAGIVIVNDPPITGIEESGA